MATHSSVLAWRIPGMGEPGGLQSMGSHRVKSMGSHRVRSMGSHSQVPGVAQSRKRLKRLSSSSRPMLGFSGGSVVKNSPTNAGDPKDSDSMAKWGRSPGVGNDNSFQYCCLENSIARPQATGLQ